MEGRAIPKFAKAVPVGKDVRNAASFFVTPVVIFNGDVAIVAGASTVVAAMIMKQTLALTRRELI